MMWSKKIILVLQGVLLVLFGLLLTEGLLRAGGFAYNYVQRTHNQPIESGPEGRQVILCLGESTTAWGLGESYPAQLQIKLNQIYGEGRYLVANEGVAGSDTEKILASVPGLIDRYRPQIVITMMGINDSWQIRGTKNFFSDFRLYKLGVLMAHNLSAWKQQAAEKAAAQQAVPPVAVPAKAAPPQPDVLPEFLNQVRVAETAYISKEYVLAASVYGKLLEQNKTAPERYFSRAGECFLRSGDKPMAEKYFSVVLKKSTDDALLANIASTYHFMFGVSDKYGQKTMKKYADRALEINPDNEEALRLLGVSYENNPETQDLARTYLEKAVVSDTNGDAIISLARVYRRKQMYSDQERILKMGLDIKTDMGFFIWRDLIVFYQQQQKFKEAEEAADQALERFPNNANLLDIRTEILKAQNKPYDHDRKDIMYWIQNFLLFQPTRENYIKTAEILQVRGIRHVAMQYPVRDIAELKKLLKDFPDVVFVENKTDFEQMVAREGYSSVFNDNFAKDFGHFNVRGSRMVVDRIIEALQKSGDLKRP